MAKSNLQYLIFFLLHVVLGVGIAASGSIAFLWGLIPVTYGLFDIVIHKNKHERAACWAAYSTGTEVVLRMQEAFVTYEAVKYYVIILLLTGLLVDRSFKKSSLVFMFLLLLLIPSVFLTEMQGDEFRKAVLFNLSGPVTLLVAGIYFYNRQVPRRDLNAILVYFVMPIVCMAIVLQLNTPDFSSIKFNAESNFETSGGFGPNQVSTLLGCGIFIILIALILKMDITGFRLTDLLVLGFFTFRGIITFSRGGILSVVIALIFFILFSFLINHPIKKRFIKYLIIIIPAVIFIWSYSIEITSGQIENRYFGKNAKGKEDKDLTSGRLSIISADYALFLENPVFGVGVGMGKFIRERKYGYLAASHSEFGRLLAEHGSLGVVFLVVLIGLVIRKMILLSTFNKIWFVTFIVYAFLTINHAAMRTALPGFVFGLAFIVLVSNSERKLV
ncbi:MAG TPA: O-antigen ligase family protein [Cyclobacteriaceae bacterium]|nr:O-antigen ligase family protein [Cyclobacteriaceae bacterium]